METKKRNISSVELKIARKRLRSNWQRVTVESLADGKMRVTGTLHDGVPQPGLLGRFALAEALRVILGHALRAR